MKHGELVKSNDGSSFGWRQSRLVCNFEDHEFDCCEDKKQRSDKGVTGIEKTKETHFMIKRFEKIPTKICTTCVLWRNDENIKERGDGILREGNIVIECYEILLRIELHHIVVLNIALMQMKYNLWI